MTATERPAERMEPVGWEVAKPLLGKRLVIPDRQAVRGMLTALGVREGKESDKTRIINTATQQSKWTRARV